MEKHNIKTKEFSNKKKENKKFLIKTASRAPTKDFNQPKQFTTTATTTTTAVPSKQSYLQRPSPTPSPLAVQLTRVPHHQNILVNPASYQDWDSSDGFVDEDLVPLYPLEEHQQYDPFFEYEEYNEEERYYSF